MRGNPRPETCCVGLSGGKHPRLRWVPVGLSRSRAQACDGLADEMSFNTVKAHLSGSRRAHFDNPPKSGLLKIPYRRSRKKRRDARRNFGARQPHATVFLK